MKTLLTVLAAGVICAGAWAADYVVEPAPSAGPAAEDPTYDASIELKWDNGSSSYNIAWYTGSGTWIGNAFDISTLSSYRGLTTMRVHTGPAWPNGSWDGFRIGVFNFAGGVPGSLIWGPRFVTGSTTNYGWNDFSVGWTVPVSDDNFVAAVEQYYNYPNCDAHGVDNNSTPVAPSWMYYSGTWSPYTNSTGYYNLMIRVILDTETLNVEPLSFGRAKAIYY
ncbi:MAG: hypothetical protein PVH29_07335 [Candidatus Zixiibacteriota bacterium]|jgi:hypothetical protein